MRITKLKILGFKSFAQRTEINFPGNGLTAVVGPNGCGKSNIVDAIRWVLGEQRAGILRMGKMQDVIFSGTEERAAMSMAEVSLVIDNSGDERKLPSDYSEVMVTRRAFRNGTSEYLLNNQECRLKDIQNLFSDSGLGTGTYSQMNERMINAVLSDKAEDRRALFEEAAGVSRYKKQRKEAVNKMASVQQSMERVEDNLRHARNSVRQYERQVERAKEVMALRTRLKSLDLSLSFDKYEDNKQALKILDESHQRLDNEVNGRQTRILTLQVKSEERKLAISEDKNRLSDLQHQVSVETIELNNLNNEMTRLREKKQSFLEAEKKANLEIENATLILAETKSEAKKIEEELEKIGESNESELLLRELELAQETLQIYRDNLDTLRKRSRELADQRFSALQTVNIQKGKKERVEAEADMLSKSVSKWSSDLENLREVFENTLDNLRKISEEKSKTEEELNALTSLAETQAQSARALRDDTRDEETSLQTFKQEEAALRSRLDVLSRMSPAEADGSKWVLAHCPEKVEGSLGAILKTNPEHISLIEFALGEALDALILPGKNSLSELLRSLSEAHAGNTSFALLSTENYPSEIPFIEGTLARLADSIYSEGPLGLFSKNLLSKWFLVSSLEQALELASAHAGKDLWFITQGIAVHTSGLIRYGNAEKLGIIGRKTEIADAETRLKNVSEQIEKITESLEVSKNRLEDAETTLSKTEDDLRARKDRLRTLEAAHEIHSNSRASLERQIEKLSSDIALANERKEEIYSSKNLDQELSSAEEDAEKFEREYEDVSQKLLEEEQVLRNKEEEVKETERILREGETLRRERETRLRALEEKRSFYENILETRRSDILKLDEDNKNLDEYLDRANEAIQKKHEELSLIEQKRDEAQERYNVVSGDLEDWLAEERKLNADILKLVSEINDIERRSEAVRDNSRRIKERIFAEWEIDLDRAESVERIEYDDSAEREIKEIRAKIKSLGGMEIPNVLENYEEEKRRLEEVEKQFDDLDHSRASLERTIKTLDAIARERFLETFSRIQKNFQDVFSRLMKDGGTKLTLQEGVDPLEAEIEVNARPTGKKMRGVKALSGGERALTAVSLLFAIYMEKPAPYCVLDEVDGPLDDANIGRFVELLRHFSRQTQFIIVTHNKRTMAASDMLYGVTQEIKGISRIASVKLEDVNSTSF